MATNRYYDEICRSMPAGLEKSVLAILKDSHVGSENRITRAQLIAKLFGKQGEKDLQNSAFDRQIRKAILTLQEQGIPVISDSGKGGYFLGTREELEAYLGELVGRRNSLDDKIKMLRRVDFKKLESRATVTQMSFFEGV